MLKSCQCKKSHLTLTIALIPLKKRTTPGNVQGREHSLRTTLFASSMLESQVLLLSTEYSFRVRQAYKTLELNLRSSSHEMHRAFLIDIGMLCDPLSKLHPPVLALISHTSRIDLMVQHCRTCHVHPAHFDVHVFSVVIRTSIYISILLIVLVLTLLSQLLDKRGMSSPYVFPAGSWEGVFEKK